MSSVSLSVQCRTYCRAYPKVSVYSVMILLSLGRLNNYKSEGSLITRVEQAELQLKHDECSFMLSAIEVRKILANGL